MKTTLSGRRAIAVAASVGAIALVLAGCARGGGDVAPTGEDTSAAVEPSPGITDTTLTFGISTPLTGATAGPGNW